jgi:bifunctional non-homologous end joining protein LigD
MADKPVKGQMPMNARQLFKPMLAEAGDPADLQALSDSGDWLFQPKYDGMRVSAYKGRKQYYVLTRTLEDVTHRFPEILEAIERLPAGTMITGEVVCFDDADERTDFNRLQQRLNLDDMQKIFAQQVVNPARLIVFDVIGVGGSLVNRKPLEERLLLLEHLPVEVAPFEEDGVKLYNELKEKGWEGIVAKKKSSPYDIDTRSPNWLKIKYT